MSLEIGEGEKCYRFLDGRSLLARADCGLSRKTAVYCGFNQRSQVSHGPSFSLN